MTPHTAAAAWLDGQNGCHLRVKDNSGTEVFARTHKGNSKETVPDLTRVPLDPADGPHVMRGYIAMLAVETSYRRYGIGSTLVKASIERMRDVAKCAEIVLETEVTNKGALNLYERLGFARDERLLKYYLNGVDAFRLALWFDRAEPEPDGEEAVKES